MNIQNIPQIKHTESGNFFLLAGPCAIESEEMAMRIAEKLVSTFSMFDLWDILYVHSMNFFNGAKVVMICDLRFTICK